MMAYIDGAGSVEVGVGQALKVLWRADLLGNLPGGHDCRDRSREVGDG